MYKELEDLSTNK